MSYVRVQGDTFTPISVRQIVKALQRETGQSLPDLSSVPESTRNARLAEYGVYPVRDDPQPDINPTTQRLERGAIREEGGEYRRGWDVIDIAPAEREADAERAADDLTQGREEFAALVRATVDLVMAARDGTLDGLSRAQVLAAYRQRVLNYLRAQRGL